MNIGGNSDILIDFLWNYSHEKFKNILSTCGETLTVEDFGYESEDQELFSYEGVSVRYGDILIKGAVKFMDSSKDWDLWHKRYPLAVKNIALVVVVSHDSFNIDYGGIPTIVVDIPRALSESYMSLTMSGHDYCPSYMAKHNSMERESILTRLFIERLQYKEEYVRKCAIGFQSNYNETLIYLFFDTLMIATRNRDAMRELCEKVRCGSIISQLSSLQHVEALLLGSAGLLDARFSADSYIWLLRNIYKEIASKFDLTPMNLSRWTISSSNPSQTIWVQLSQLASILFHHKDLLFKVIYAHTLKDINDLLMVPIGEYWRLHNYPGKEFDSIVGMEYMSQQKRNTFLINCIVPFMFFYNRENSYDGGDDEYVDVLISLLTSTPAEVNKYTRNWTSAGVVVDNAFDSQALIQLNKIYCDNDRCHKCPLGIGIMERRMFEERK
ncbi:MAG: DUF2851 family protein [Rikenellaceae bacterium]